MLSQIFSTAIIADPKYVVKFETEILCGTKLNPSASE